MLRRGAPDISICFLAAGVGRGGAERQLLYMLEALQDSPVSCRVMTLTTDLPWEKDVEAMGIPMEHVGLRASRVVRQAAIIRSLRRDRADIVQSAHFFTNLYAAVGARATGAYSIGAIRNDLKAEINGNRPYGWAHLFLPHYMIANSAAALDQAIAYRRSAADLLLVENVVDTARFAPRAVADRRRDHELRVLFVGRLVQQKRADRFLRLVRSLGDALTGWTVEARIAGDGPLRADLQSQAAALGLSPERVRFLGQVEDMDSHYRWADAFVLTSDFEGTPNVVLEAMAHALPVVAFAVSGVPTLLVDGRGLLVEPDDERSLVEAVLRLARSPELQEALGDQGRTYVTQTRSVEALTPRLERFYRSILGTGR